MTTAQRSAEDEANDILMGGGGVSFDFAEVGDSVTGIITALTPQQQTDFKTKDPLFWADGRKRMQVRVTLQTELTDWEGTKDPEDRDGEDDGVRNVYLRYKSADAVKKAVAAAGEKKLRSGGKLKLTFSGKEKPRERGAQPTKLYEARYKPPVDEVDMDEMDAPETPAETPAKPARSKAVRAKAQDHDAPDDDAADPGF